MIMDIFNQNIEICQIYVKMMSKCPWLVTKNSGCLRLTHMCICANQSRGFMGFLGLGNLVCNLVPRKQGFLLSPYIFSYVTKTHKDKNM